MRRILPLAIISILLVTVATFAFLTVRNNYRASAVAETEAELSTLPGNAPFIPPAKTYPESLPSLSPAPKLKIESRGPLEKPYPSKEALGAALFIDPILSADGSRSCITCHIPEHGFASKGIPLDMTGKPLVGNRKGIKAEMIPKGMTIADYESGRKAPSLTNCVYGKSFFWDGRAATLEDQCLDVIGNKEEMGGNVNEALKRVSQVERYRESFRVLYGKLTASTLANAIATFERTLVSGRGRWDDYLDGKGNPLTPREVRGFDLFRGKAQCYHCHTGPNLTDEGFHNTGVGLVHHGKDIPHQIDDALFADTDSAGGHFLDWGRANVTVTGKGVGYRDMGKFKTPSLRGVKLHGPYFHDASAPTLADVIRFYNVGGKRNVNLDRFIRPLGLTVREESDLLAFLEAL